MSKSGTKRERIYMRVGKGNFYPADACAQSKLRERGYRVGDLVVVDVCKPRNPKFNGLVHKLGMLIVENIDDFAGMESHAAIKRIQWEGNIACEEIGVSMRSAWNQIAETILTIPGMTVIKSALDVVGAMLPEKAVVTMRQPRSLSFESMDEMEFHSAAKGICRTISERYWPDMSPERIESMAELMVLD